MYHQQVVTYFSHFISIDLELTSDNKIKVFRRSEIHGDT